MPVVSCPRRALSLLWYPLDDHRDALADPDARGAERIAFPRRRSS
jgi:hypothetical protein